MARRNSRDECKMRQSGIGAILDARGVVAKRTIKFGNARIYNRCTVDRGY